MKYFVLFLLLLASCQASVDEPGNEVPTSLEELSNPDKLSVYYFHGDGCPICEQQKPFMDRLEREYDIDVVRLEIYYNRVNQQLFREVSAVYNTEPRGVPTTFIGEESWIGYNARIGGQIESYIVECLQNGCEELI